MDSRWCCKWWKSRVPPLWLVLSGVIFVQVECIASFSELDKLVHFPINRPKVGFGLYPVLVKKLASHSNPLVFSFYRDLCCFPLLFLCALIAERRLLFPGLKMMLVKNAIKVIILSLSSLGLFSVRLYRNIFKSGLCRKELAISLVNQSLFVSAVVYLGSVLGKPRCSQRLSACHSRLGNCLGRPHLHRETVVTSPCKQGSTFTAKLISTIITFSGSYVDKTDRNSVGSRYIRSGISPLTLPFPS